MKNKLQNYIYKYRNMSKAVKASLWFTVMSILQKGITFLVTPVYTRLLTTEEYGYYSVVNSWCNILVVIATLSLFNAVFNNGMTKYENDRKRYISSMEGLSGTTTIIVFLVVVALRSYICEWTGIEFSIICVIFLYLFFYPPYMYWSMYQRYIYEYRNLSIVTISVSLCILILSISLIYLYPNRKYSVVLGTLFAQILFGAFFYIKNLIDGHKLFVWEYWKFALKFSIPLIPHYLSGIILGQADRIMIQSMVGQDKAGIYSLVYNISVMLNVVISGINASFVPWTYKKIKSKEYKRIGTMSKYILVLLGIIVVVGVLVAPEIIRILGTEEYMEAKWIMAPILMSIYFTMLYSLFANVEFYYEKSIYVMIASVIAAVLNIALNVYAIPKWGYLAAAYTTMIGYFVLVVMHYLFMKKVCRKNAIKDLHDDKFIVGFTILLTVVAFALMLTYNSSVVRYVIIAFIIVMMYISRKKIARLFDFLGSR